MADTNPAPQEQTTADAFAEAAKEQGLEVADPEETSTQTTETADEGSGTKEEKETDESDVETEDSPEGKTDSTPSLDQIVRDAIGENPEAIEAWENHWKGVEKREAKLGEREETLKSDEKGYEVYRSYAEAFASEDPDTVRKAYEFLGKQLFGEGDKAKTESEPTENEDGTIQYDGQTFSSEGEVFLYKQLQELRSQKDPDIEALKEDRRIRQEAEARAKWLDGKSQSIIARVQKTTGGWGVTKDQISKVLESDRAGLESDPVLAMKRAFPDEYADWREKRAKAKPDIPDMAQGSDAKGLKLPEDKSEWTFEQHAYAISNGLV